jgi:NitT/TauT family transport system permease protein
MTRSLPLLLCTTAAVALLSYFALIYVHAHAGAPGALYWIFILLLWLAASQAVAGLARLGSLNRPMQRMIDLLVPVCFGAFLLFLWEVLTVGLRVPMVLLPSPSAIAAKLMSAAPVLFADFVQTFIRAVIPGWIIGCLAGFAVAVAADRVPFLARGLIPIGNFVSALPIIGIAPIMVMWFGFDWHSKAAVVVMMTFFPMLVNTIAGLSQSGRLERDLMRSYGAGHWETLVKLKLPAALPFIFNALKINSTLALIGAIVAEFFGTPIVGMGFRISTEVGRMSLDMVWAEIAVAAVAGSALYGAIALLERGATFWHPSYRSR